MAFLYPTIMAIIMMFQPMILPNHIPTFRKEVAMPG